MNSLDLNHGIGKRCNAGYRVLPPGIMLGRDLEHMHPSFSKGTRAGPGGNPAQTSRFPQSR